MKSSLKKKRISHRYGGHGDFAAEIGHVHYRVNFAGIIECILLELFHKWRRQSNAYQGKFNEFCYKFIECIEQTQISICGNYQTHIRDFEF